MRSSIAAIASVSVLMLSGCGPSFNWRDTPIVATSLTALFPCKPLHASRKLALGGGEVELHMTGCDTGGVTLAVGHATISDPRMLGPALEQWREAALAGIHAQSPSLAAFRLERVLENPPPVRVEARGARPDGRAVTLQGVWFAHGTEVFGALLYGETLSPEVADTFFAGLQFR